MEISDIEKLKNVWWLLGEGVIQNGNEYRVAGRVYATNEKGEVESVRDE